MRIYGHLWDFVVLSWGFMVDLLGFHGIYPLVNVATKLMRKIHNAIDGKLLTKKNDWAIFPSELLNYQRVSHPYNIH